MAYTGKVAFITGAGSGMGQLAARQFADTGASVAAFDINAEGLANTAEGYDNIHCYSGDITDFDSVKAIVDEVETTLGPIDRLYNCAAIMPLGKILEHDIKQQHKIIDINLGGLMNITHAALPAMVARGHGDFVSFASMAGVIPTLLTGVYSTSKAAVYTFNEILYHENRDSGVRFANVCPPAVATPLLKQGRDTVWPKMLDTDSPIEPQQVLARIEECLDKGIWLVTVGKGANIGPLTRRFIPNTIWKHVHKMEGF